MLFVHFLSSLQFLRRSTAGGIVPNNRAPQQPQICPHLGLGLGSCGKETLAPLAKNGTRLLGSQWANIDVVWYRFMCCDPANSLNDTTFYINQQLREGQFTYGPMCETRGPVRCTWYDSLDAVTSCPLCSGGGLFVQNKTIAHTPKPP